MNMQFLRAASAAVVSLCLSGAFAAELGDNLWMWGHDTGHYDGPVNYARHDYKIPWSAPITMPDACLDMGIPNCCVIRPGMPPPDDDYLPPYKKLKRISWLLWNSTKEYCLEKAVKIDNIAAFDLDDFFLDEIVEDERPDGTKVKVRKGVMTLKEIDATRKELSEKAGHPVELRMVLYVHQLCPEIVPAVEMMDKVLLWTWNGSDIKSMRDNILKFRSIAPNTPIILGLYMWDFGGHKPITREFMQSQLDLAEEFYRQGVVEGLIFHCTPLVNKNLEAVNLSREWIRNHRHDRFGVEPRKEAVLFLDGVAKCRVVTAANASKPELFGKAELEKYLPKVYGCGALDGDYPISISVDADRVKTGELKEDGFILDVREDGLSVIGANPRGALYGCYEILKRFAGIRWLVPGEDGEYVPSYRHLILPPGRKVFNPYLKIRKNRGGEPNLWLWNARNCMQSEAHPRAFAGKDGELLENIGAFGTGPGGHMMSDLLLGGGDPKMKRKDRVDQVFAEHPEWFPLIGGKRVKISGAGDPNPCLSNPALLDRMAENLVAALSAPHAAEAHITIGNNDTTAWCECENCRALDVPGVRAKQARSDRYWYVVGEIAKRVWAKLPDAKLGGWAYQDFWYPPAKVRIDPRLRVLISYNNQCWKHTVEDEKCPINAEWRSIYRAWEKTGLPLVVNRDEISASDSPGSTMAPSEQAVWDDVIAYPKYGCNGINFCVGSPFPAFQKWHEKVFPWYGKNYRWYAMWRVNYLAAIAAFYGEGNWGRLGNEAGRLYYGAGWGGKDGIAAFRWHLEDAFYKTPGCQGWGIGSQLGACLAKFPQHEKRMYECLDAAENQAKESGDERALRNVRREREMFEMTWIKSYRNFIENYREHDVFEKKGEITIDGVLDEQDWADAKPLDGFKRPPWQKREIATVQTVAKIVRSKEALYFAVECLEPEMGKTVAKKKIDPAHPWHEFGDHIELFYQYPDMAEKCYHMMINSEGQMFCGIQVTSANFDGNFTTRAQVAVKRYPDKWVAEVMVPTSEIGMQCFDGASWRANVARQRTLADGTRESSSAANGDFNGTGNHVNLKFVSNR